MDRRLVVLPVAVVLLGLGALSAYGAAGRDANPVPSAVAGTVDLANGAINSADAQAGVYMGQAVDGTTGLVNQAKGGLDGTLAGTGVVDPAVVDSPVDTLNAALRNIGDSVTKTLGGVTTTLTRTLTGVSETVTTTTNGVSTTLTKTLGTTGVLLVGAGSDVSETVSDVQAALNQLMSNGGH